VGLAANQVGIDRMIAVANPTGEIKDEITLINAEIIESEGSETLVPGSVDDPRDPRQHREASAHQAWLQSGVEGAALQPPVAQVSGGFGYHEMLGVGGGEGGPAGPVPVGVDPPRRSDQYCPYRYFTR